MGSAAKEGRAMISFHEMKPEDAAAVEGIERASFAVPWSRRAFWEEAANERTLYLVARMDGEIVGYAGAWIILDEAQITNVAVAPEKRGQGIGRRLMDEMMARAKARGASRMTLEVRPSNAVALTLYKSCGFLDYGRRPRYYQDNGEDAVIMWKMEL